MMGQSSEKHQIKKQVRTRIIQNSGQLVYEYRSLIKAVFSEDKIETAIRTLFEITENLDQKAVLSGGNRLTVFLV